MPERSEGEILNKLYSLVCTKIGFSEVSLVLQNGQKWNKFQIYVLAQSQNWSEGVGFESWIPIFSTHTDPKCNNVWKKYMCSSEARAKCFEKNGSFLGGRGIRFQFRFIFYSCIGLISNRYKYSVYPQENSWEHHCLYLLQGS